jgi:hypothetical protein
MFFSIVIVGMVLVREMRGEVCDKLIVSTGVGIDIFQENSDKGIKIPAHERGFWLAPGARRSANNAPQDMPSQD